jgi:peptide chain release factor 1
MTTDTHRRTPIQIEVRPGEGGTDAVNFAQELTGLICAHLRRVGDTPTVTSRDRTTVIQAKPDRAVAALAGTHRVQRIPRNDPRGRRHTSTATVAILAAAETGPVPELPPKEVSVEMFSGSGAGGQYRNRHKLCARVRHLPTGLVAVSTEHRSAPQNVEAALAELSRRVHQIEAERRIGERNAARRAQVVSDRSAKTWTWNEQRNEVVEHTSGRRWPMKEFSRGKMPVGLSI